MDKKAEIIEMINSISDEKTIECLHRLVNDIFLEFIMQDHKENV